MVERRMIRVVFWKGRRDVHFLVLKEEDDRVLIFTESPEKARQFGLEEIEPGKYGRWVNVDEVKFTGRILSDNVVKWRGELLTVSSYDENGNLLLRTGRRDKAKKLGMRQTNKGEYTIWVPEEEVEVVGNSERFWREKRII